MKLTQKEVRDNYCIITDATTATATITTAMSCKIIYCWLKLTTSIYVNISKQ